MSDLAVGYIRVSKLRLDKNGKKISADDSLGLEAQTQAIRAYCKMRKLRLLPEPLCDADVSGRRPLAKRPAGSALLAMTTRRMRPIKHVVMFKLDRGFRNTVDCLMTMEKWTKLGVKLHAIDFGVAIDTSTATGKLILTFMAGINQYTPDVTSERCKAAQAVLKQRGRKFCRHAPYGFKHVADLPLAEDPEDQTYALEEEPSECATLTRILELRRSGLSYRQLSAKLAALNLLDRSGKPFDRRLLHKIVTRAA